MAVREHHLGKGTIGYRGESAAYWRAKTEALPRRRARVTLLLVALALGLALFAVSPLGPHTVTAQVQSRAEPLGGGPGGETERLVLLLDGERLIDAPVVVQGVEPRIGSSLVVTEMADGRIVTGNQPIIGVWGLVLLFGTAATWRLLYAYRLRDRRTVYR